MIEIAKLADITQDITEIELRASLYILVKHSEQISMFDAHCPHQGASLAQGHVENDHLVCPMHGRKFSCEDGSEEAFGSCLKKYAVVNVDEVLFVDEEDLLGDDMTDQQGKSITLRDLPSPPKKPIIGHLKEVAREDRHLALEQWVEETGDLFQVSLMGKKLIVSADYEINAEILKKRPQQFSKYSKIGEVMHEMGLMGVFSAEGDQWRKHRKVTAEALNTRNVKRFFPILHEMTSRLQNRWRAIAEGDHISIDVHKEMTYYTVDMTTKIAFGYDTKTLLQSGDVIQNHLEKIFPTINRRIILPFPIWRYLKTKKDKEFERALSQVQLTVQKLIDEARKRIEDDPNKEPDNFLEALLMDPDSSFSDQEIFGNVFTILLAGEDTTSNTIAWTLYYLLKNPEVFKKVREEADYVIGNDEIANNYDMLQKLSYTEAVAMEAIRMKPAAPILMMQALEDVQVGKLHVEKGSSVLLQNKVPQTDEQYFKDADVFIPERWMQQTMGEKCPFSGHHNPDVITAFGGGPRFCPGKLLAMQEIKIAISMICKNFEIGLEVDTKDIKEALDITMYPKNFMISLKKRESIPDEQVMEPK